MTEGVVRPAYGRASLSDLMPSVLQGMGVEVAGDTGPGLDLARRDRVCLFLIDGLGREVLAAAHPHDAPFLQGLLASGLVLDAGFPASTPISLCSLGTGRTPGEHGIVGFTMHIPPVPAVLECLTWVGYGDGVDLTGALPPERLQPLDTVWAAAEAAGVPVTVVSVAAHVGTGLTRAAFRGARFDPIDRFEDIDDRCERVRLASGRSERSIVYTYDARLDTAMHRSGIGSEAWREALRAVDVVAAALSDALPSGASLLITGDHGGLDVVEPDRVDLADRDDLARDVAWLSGDPRARHVHAAPGRAADVHDAWSAGLDGGGWLVLTRDEAIGSGLFGPLVREEVRARIGDLVAVALGRGGLFDRSRFPWERRLTAFHGGLAPAELQVPLLRVD